MLVGGLAILGGFVLLGSCVAIATQDDPTMPVTENPPAVAQPVVEQPNDTIGNGTHIVGTDIQPGTYRSAGAEPGIFELCVWSTLDGPSSNSNTLDFGTANADDQQVVEISESVGAFETSGCSPWERVN
jgi:hypothetical protein